MTYSSDIVDLIDLLVPYSKSSISSVDKILEYIQSNQCINTLDAFHKITIDQEQHVD
jgi:bacterioferritin (cytochrome b1)